VEEESGTNLAILLTYCPFLSHCTIRREPQIFDRKSSRRASPRARIPEAELSEQKNRSVELASAEARKSLPHLSRAAECSKEIAVNTDELPPMKGPAAFLDVICLGSYRSL
jgi:hypothetical protein